MRKEIIRFLDMLDSSPIEFPDEESKQLTSDTELFRLNMEPIQNEKLDKDHQILLIASLRGIEVVQQENRVFLPFWMVCEALDALDEAHGIWHLSIEGLRSRLTAHHEATKCPKSERLIELLGGE